MRDYKKPFIEDEEIELEDIIATSPGGEGDLSEDPNAGDGTEIFF